MDPNTYYTPEQICETQTKKLFSARGLSNPADDITEEWREW